MDYRLKICSASLVVLMAQAVTQAQDVDFAHDVAPLIKLHCSKCHTNGTYKAGLSMDTRSKLIESGVVEPGDAVQSEFIARLTAEDPDVRMPADAPPLSDKQIAVLTDWVNQGARWQDGFSFQASSFRRSLHLKRPELPPVANGRTNPIDRFVDDYWSKKGAERPESTNDAAFLRRIYLDTIGLLPSMEDLHEYVNDKSDDRRRRLAARLLSDNRKYAEHWFTFWNDLLRNDFVGTGYIDGGRKQISGWLYDALVTNKRYDVFVRELISPTPESEGFIKGIKWRGRVNASQIPELQFAQNVSQVFLGLNMKCASCHDSFINELKLTDAYGMAAIIADSPLQIHRCDKPTGDIASAAFLYPELGEVDASAGRSQRLDQTARLITSSKNGRFARTIVNRIWERLMGRGLVHPVDIMGNESWNEPLLDFLAVHLIDSGYDVKRTIELVVTSDTYACRSTDQDVLADSSTFVFDGPAPKRMTAEQFVDAVWSITGTHPSKPAIDLGDRAGEPVRASIVRSDALMRILGRPNREQVVTTRPAQLTTLQALDLTNGPTLTSLLDRGAERVMNTHEEKTSREIVAAIFRQSLQRIPENVEYDMGVELIGETKTKEGIADLLWTVFMLPEFQIIR